MTTAAEQTPNPGPDPAGQDWHERAHRIKALRAVPQLRAVAAETLRSAADALQPLDLAADTVLCERDQPADRLYLLVEGELSHGQAHCGAAALTGAGHPATVRTTVACRLLTLDPAAVPGLLGGFPATTGVLVEAVGVSRALRSGRLLLDQVSLTAAPGRLLALVGSSGVGKTVLLEALAGVHPPSQGTVRHDGRDQYTGAASRQPVLGYVPQDDIIHLDLPLRRTLEYAARLRLPADSGREQITAAVEEVLAVLDLTARADTRVGALSGGERKRASIGVELLTKPRVFFLDEPTSGLDPATGAELMRLLRRMADAGCTVVLTTHNPADVALCDQVAVLVTGGRLVFTGTPAAAVEHFRTESFAEVYQRLAAEPDPRVWAERFRPEAAPAPPAGPAAVPPVTRRPGPLRQWAVLTRRNVETMVRNRLTLALLVGSPVMIVLMFAVLFQRGVFDPAAPNPQAAAMVLFWVGFGGFFFGLTYGLLQICTEYPVFRRERFVGLGVLTYLAAKATLLLPLLVAVDVAMLAVLRALDRLPAADSAVYLSLGVTLVLTTAAALALGLLTSAAVTDSVQATIALPMLCFPQVLFTGAFVPVPQMATAGEAISAAMSNRWSFEALGHGADLNGLLANGRSPLGPPLLRQYGDTFSDPVWTGWLALAGFTVLFTAGAYLVLRLRTRTFRR